MCPFDYSGFSAFTRIQSQMILVREKFNLFELFRLCKVKSDHLEMGSFFISVLYS